VKTRDGYYLNETPFYFVVGDEKSEPLYISKDTDGGDFDGMTVKAVLDSFGKATITIDVLKEYPAATVTVNSVSQLQTLEYTDMTRYLVNVTESSPADITLPNGKVLTLSVDGSTYSYTYDGTSGQYVPEAAYTGYFAKYTMEEKQADVNNPQAKILVFTAAKGTSQLTAETVYEPVMIQNPDNPEDPLDLVQKTDENGNKVFDYYVNLSVDGGTSVRLDEGEKRTLTAADGAAYIIAVDDKGNITVSVSSSLDGAIDENQMPAVIIDGIAQTEGLDFVKSVTLTRQDSSAKTVQVKINTTDNLNSGEINNDAKDVPKGPDIPYIPDPANPSIRTTAVDSDTNDHISEADKYVTIIDTVTCWNLTIGREYILKGILMDQSTGSELMVNGKTVTSEVKFKATAANGTVDVTFNFDGSQLGGKSVVVFEELYLLTDLNSDGTFERETKVAEHRDITDEGQTVYLQEKEEEPKPENPVEEPKEEEPETPVSDVPKTGDSSHMNLWILLMLASGISIILLIRRREY